MRFPTMVTGYGGFTKGRAIVLVAFSMLALGGCEPAEQQNSDRFMLRVPSTLWGSKSFPALGKALAAAKPGRSVEIVLDFPRHPYGYPYPQHVCSSGPMPIRINRGRVHLVSGDTYITLLPDKQFLCKSTEDGRELALHFHPKFDYDLEIDAGSLKAGGGGHSLDEHGEDAWDKCGIRLPKQEHGDWVRVRFRVECSSDFDGELGDYSVWQPL